MTHQMDEWQPEILDISCVDDIFVKTMTFRKKDSVVPQHSHEYEHLSVISTGAVRIWQDDRLLGDFYAPHHFTVKARCKHKFLTLEENTMILCIHNISRTGEILIDEHHEIVKKLEVA